MSKLINKTPTIIISGPTASGKTAQAIQFAQVLIQQKFTPLIINFDSLCFYSDLNIGTAKPSLNERSICPHYMFDITTAKEPLDAAKYMNLATKVINENLNASQAIILVGGSGFYLRALLKGMYNSPASPQAIKDKVLNILNQQGKIALHQILATHDLASAQKLHPNDSYRVSRALEYYYTTGEKFSVQKSKMDAQSPYNFSHNIWPQLEIFHTYLNLPKEEHYPYIQKRTEKMIQDGLIQEVQALLDLGHTGNERPLKSIGYKESLQYLHNIIKDQAELAEKINIATRQLAKAQRTFFNKCYPKTQYHPLKDQEKISIELLNFLNQW